MPPKKKQQEIDLSTLPQCHSINVFLISKGKVTRSQDIVSRIHKQAEKFMFKIKKSQVLEHAKEKNIYIDPSTLTDKQKKDAKFMESICTELTPVVLAKALQSHLNALNIKARIEKKNNPGVFANQKRKYDVIYVLEDFPQTTVKCDQLQEQFEEIAKIGEGVKYVLVVEPKITWINAPELPQPAAEGQQEQNGPEQQDQEIKEYKKLLEKEQLTEDDIQFEKGVNQKIEQVKSMRSRSAITSQFRNCTISTLQHQIDPYHQENSLNELVKAFFDNIDKLDAQFIEFQEWKKGKQGEPLPEKVEVAPKEKAARCLSMLGMLDAMAKGMDEKGNQPEKVSDQDQVLRLIADFGVSMPSQKGKSQKSEQAEYLKFLQQNQQTGVDSSLKSQLRNCLKYPGIDRNQMPQMPSLSQGLRKLNQSHFSHFLPSHLSLSQFLRRQNILSFEQHLKQLDEDRPYSFADRIYEQHHSCPSLKRQLYRAQENGEASIFSKYDENSDKLFVVMGYRNNARRVNKKQWEANWKVVPNYQYWLKYFKNNQNNLGNGQFYDVDYQQIGNIQEDCKTYTLKNGITGAVVIDKALSAGNKTHNQLYALKNQLILGINASKFYSQHGNTKTYHHKAPLSPSDQSLSQQTEHSPQKSPASPQQFQTILLLPTSRIRISSTGTVLFQSPQTPTRMVTPQGYTIVYQPQKTVILHPNGGITYNHDHYVNQRGYGQFKGNLHNALTLERTAKNGKITKREDGTVIVNNLGEKPEKWIRFYQGTEYQVVQDEIKIQKQGVPFVTCSQGTIQIIADDIVVKVEPTDHGYSTSVEFRDGVMLKMDREEVVAWQKDQKQTIKINIESNEISSVFQDQQVIVSSSKSTYKRGNRIVDPCEDQQKYTEQDILPADYLEPRLFIINNDNTGVQLLSQAMVIAYLSHHAKDIQQLYETQKDGKIQMHIVERIDREPKKYIRNSLVVELDVFDNSKDQVPKKDDQSVYVRTLVKHPPLASEDVAEIGKIRKEVETWRKNNVKDENQFGYKPKDQAALNQRIKTKMLSLQTRKQNDPKVDTQLLRNTGQESYKKTVDTGRQEQEQKLREQQLRRQYLKKRDSIIRDFKSINLVSKRSKRQQGLNEDTNPFLDNYFMTVQGKQALAEMPQWVFRAKEHKKPAELDPEIKQELINNSTINREDEVSEGRERYDTVEVELNPRPEKEIFIKPSVFTQRQIDEQRSAFQSQKKAYKYHESKRKDFNLYGQQRKTRPQVRTLIRTQAISEINQKYLVTQAPLDNKVKISSMKNKLTSSASGMAQMRKEGPHSLLMKTLDKGNDVNRLLERRTMMVQADLNDKLQRDILINPVQANFGVLMERKCYELKIDIKNQDIIAQRITLKRPKSIYAKVTLSEMGPIAMGMSRKIIVTLKASSDIIGKFSDEFDIVTKHEIYHIPITAHIVSENQLKNETLNLSRGVSEIEQGFKKRGNNTSVQFPPLK